MNPPWRNRSLTSEGIRQAAIPTGRRACTSRGATPRTGLGGNHRIGNEPNRATANLWCGVYRDDGTRFRHNGEELALERVDGGLAAGPQRMFDDGGTLRFVLETDSCRIDVAVEDDDATPEKADATTFTGTNGIAGAIFSENVHAFCRVRGTVEVDGQRAVVDAPGWRDHSSGVRHWDSFLASRTFGGALGAGLQFRYGSMVGSNGSFFRHGAVIRDGSPLDVEHAEMVVHLDDDALRCRAAELHYHLGDGTEMKVHIDVVGGMIGATRERYGWESVGDVSVDGQTGGWGFLEVNNNPRNGRDVPVLVLGDGLVNGVTRGRAMTAGEGAETPPSEAQALYYRQLRDAVRGVLGPELTSAQAIDAAGIVDRILAELIVEEESGAQLFAELGDELDALLHPGHTTASAVTPTRFDELRAEASEVTERACRSRDPGDRELGRRIADLEHRFLERLDALRVSVLAAPSEARAGVDACSVTKEQVTAYLRRRLPGSPEVVVDCLTVVPGGRSKETILVALHGTRELPPELILRKDRPVSVLPTRAADEFEVIRAVHAYGGVPVPEPFFAEREGHELGEGTFLVMERMPGHKAGEHFPDLAAPMEHRGEIGEQLAVALARLHSLPVDRLDRTSLDPGKAVVTTESLVASVDGIAARIADLSGPPCATVGVAHAWLIEHAHSVAPAPRLSLLQADFGFHNMLIDDGRVTALVDWEAATIGPPARELAAAWNAINALMPWPRFVDAYLDAGGSPDDADPKAISYYRLLGALGAYMASRTGGHLFLSGAKRDLQTAHSSLDSRIRCERNLSRALHDAMDEETD